MSVMWVGGQRFAVGMLWQRGRLTGGAARRAARESRSAWTVEVSGQTGLVDDAEGPGGTKPLAGALMALLRGRSPGDATWIAFVEEDGEGEAVRRVAVVRCSEELLLADGDAVYANAQEAVEAVGLNGLEDVLVAVTPGLRSAFPGALEVDGAGVRNAAGDVDLLLAVGSRGISRKGAVWLAVFVAIGAAGIYGWTDRLAIGIRLGWIEEKKERPRVDAEIDTHRFLSHCRDEIARRELGLVGFERIAIYCHAQYERDKKVGAPKKLTGRPVLEVRWQLRKPLQPRVYVGLAQARLAPWFWAGVHDKGDAAGIVALPQVLVLSSGVEWPPHPVFRERIDRLLALRGFRIEYTQQKKVEVVLETARPLSEAVAMLAGVEGLEIVKAAFENGRWRFEGRRRRVQSMFEDKFRKVTAPLAWAAPTIGEGKLERAAS